jgi:hypothetical protein
MNRLQHLVFRVRGAMIRWEIAALQRRQLKAQRRFISRPHVPSAYLVADYPIYSEPLEDAAATVLWFRVALLVVAFAAGVLFADVARSTAPAEDTRANGVVCSAEYETPQQ